MFTTYSQTTQRTTCQCPRKHLTDQQVIVTRVVGLVHGAIVPTGGSIFLFDRAAVRFFRKDGFAWRKKPDGRTVRETHEKLKVRACTSSGALPTIPTTGQRQGGVALLLCTHRAHRRHSATLLLAHRSHRGHCAGALPAARQPTARQPTHQATTSGKRRGGHSTKLWQQPRIAARLPACGGGAGQRAHRGGVLQEECCTPTHVLPTACVCDARAHGHASIVQPPAAAHDGQRRGHGSQPPALCGWPTRRAWVGPHATTPSATALSATGLCV